MEGALNEAFRLIFADPFVLGLIFIGVFIGIIFGAIPGLTAMMAIVMFLPITFWMSPVRGISMLVSLYIGGISGGLITAILLNIPGTPSNIATVFDGYPMAQKGMAGKALGLGIVFSFFGTLMGIALLILISPQLATIAIRFGAYEYFALALFALSLVVVLTGKDMVKGFISCVIGLIFATVGMAPIDSRPRFTFGQMELFGGIKLIAVLIGLFAITEVIKYAEKCRDPSAALKVDTNFKIRGFGFSLKEFFKQIPNCIRSSFVGVGIGILPGIGGGTAAMVAYTVAKNTSKTPELFGTGCNEGIVSCETSNSANIGGNMIPLLSLGIPGDAATAVILGGFMMHGVVPGPLVFQTHGTVIYGVFIAMVLASFMLVLQMFLGIRLFAKLLAVPKQYLLPVVLVFCVVGTIGDSNVIFDLWGMLLFGLIAYGLTKVDVPLIPMILGFILGPILEFNLRRSSQLFVRDPVSVFQHPIAVVFFAITLVLLIYNIRTTLKLAKKEAEKAAAE